MKKALVIGGAILGVILIAGLLESQRKKAMPAPPPSGGSEQATLKCGPVGAYALTKRWVDHVNSGASVVYPSFQDGFVQHQPGTLVYHVQAYYLEGERRVEFSSDLECTGDSWKADGLTVNGRHFPGTEQWSGS